MTKRLIPLAFVLAFAVTGIWFATRDSDDRGASRGDAAVAPTDPAPEPTDPGQPGPDLNAATEEPSTKTVAAAETVAERTAASTDYEAELAEGHWIEGHVVFPADTPPDEKLRVVANGRSFEHGPDHGVTVGRDGRFRLAFSKKTRSGKLEVEGTYLFLEDAVKIDTRDDPEPIVLEPVLGGAIKGRVIPPDDDPETLKALVGRRVQLSGYARSGSNSWRSRISKSVELDESLEYFFGGLSTQNRFEISMDPMRFEPVEIDDLFVQPGVTSEYALEVLHGNSFLGEVVDEAGEPINAAQVTVQVETSSGGWNRGRHRNHMTSEGKFEIAGASPGKTTLEVEAKGYEDEVLELGKLERGTVTDGLRIVLKRGNSLAGVVLRPDGEPAAGATITTESSDGNSGWSMFGDGVKADGEGQFTVTGLEPGVYRVNATYSIKEKVPVVSKLTGKERMRSVRKTLRAALTDIEAGRSDLVLQVSEGNTISGMVFDDVGAPVPEFKVHYGRLFESDSYSWVRNQRGKTFKDGTGAFEITGLEKGRWQFEVSADGHLGSEEREIEIPGETLEPFRIKRAAFVSGVVLNPAGEPVREASIEIAGSAAPIRHANANTLVFADIDDESFNWYDNTDGAGEFELKSVPPGAVRVRASAEGYAPSESVAIELGPGQRVENLTLRLSGGVTLTGLVVADDGSGIPRRMVEIDQRSGPFDTTVQTDEAGGFEVGGLEPGEYMVTVNATGAELAKAGLEGLDGIEDLLRRKEAVEVGPSGAHIVLPPPDIQPVRLHGRVTVGGKPADGRMWIRPAEGGNNVRADLAEGEYSVALRKPGDYNLSVNLEGSDANISRKVQVSGNSQRFDIDIPVGGITGRVLGPDGPVKEMWVQARRTRNEHGEEQWSHASTQTDSDGEYEFVDLPCGTWQISAGGRNSWASGKARFLGEDTVPDVVVTPGNVVTGADLHLAQAGLIEGRVVDRNGLGVEDMRIFIRDADGESLDQFGSQNTNNSGSFTIRGLEAGSYTLIATGAGHASGQPHQVSVVPGEVNEVEIPVDRGTILSVRASDADGDPIKASVTILRDGQNVVYLTDWQVSNTAGEGERRFGPYPPGTYVVTASKGDLRAPSQTVNLGGEELRELTFQLN